MKEEKGWGLVTASEEQGNIKIAAIDNGLAFPFKHPDEWRTCTHTHRVHSMIPMV